MTYYEKNKERIKEYNRRRYVNNRERNMRKCMEWQKAHPLQMNEIHLRLIDADALREKWLCLQGHDFSPSSFVYSIDHAPTIDAVPVVRCKYCVYCRKEDDFEYWCEGFCNPPRLVSMNDFCSHGKFRCENTMCGYCENGKCFNESHVRVKHNCRYGKENDDADN